MGVRQVAALAALLAAAPCQADEILNQQTAPMTMFFVSIPLGGVSAKERAPSYGFALQGKRQFETVSIDTRTLSAFETALAGIEAKWLIVGGVVAAAGVYAVSKDKKRSDNYSGSQNQQQNNPPPPPPCDPCKP